jgi:tetratricopeptide (TPR) repeat protein
MTRPICMLALWAAAIALGLLDPVPVAAQSVPDPRSDPSGYARWCAGQGGTVDTTSGYGCSVSGGGSAGYTSDAATQGLGAALAPAAHAAGEALGKMLRDAFFGTPGPSAQQVARGKSVKLNNEGVALSEQGREAEALDKYSEAIAADPTNDVAQANYYILKAQIDARANDLDNALFEARRAVAYSNAPDARNVTLDTAEGTVSMVERAVADRNSRRQRQFASSEQALAGQMRTLDAGDADSDFKLTPVRGPFGTPAAKPVDIHVRSLPQGQAHSAMEQLVSASESGAVARSEQSDTAAHNWAGCALDTQLCVTPPSVPPKFVPRKPLPGPAIKRPKSPKLVELEKQREENQAEQAKVQQEIDALKAQPTPENLKKMTDKKVELGKLEQKHDYLDFSINEENAKPAPAATSPGNGTTR